MKILQALEGKIGIVVEPKSERELETVIGLDYALVDSRIFREGAADYVLTRLRERLVDHGLIVLRHESDEDPFPWIQRVLAGGGVELLDEEDGTYFLFRVLKAKVVEVKPLRYRVVDGLNDVLSRVPAVKYGLKRLLLRGA